MEDNLSKDGRVIAAIVGFGSATVAAFARLLGTHGGVRVSLAQLRIEFTDHIAGEVDRDQPTRQSLKRIEDGVERLQTTNDKSHTELHDRLPRSSADGEAIDRSGAPLKTHATADETERRPEFYDRRRDEVSLDKVERIAM